MFDFAQPRPRRKISLTPMIDVVFLLLIFFMLVSRFGLDMAVPLGLSSGGASSYSGPPRLISVTSNSIKLNGIETPLSSLNNQITDLVSAPDDVIVLRPVDGANLERIIQIIDTLGTANFTNVVLVE
ncbi:indolepyruvate ferredoxin oxidoreductase [Marivivens niveibacter]|uniref:Indolepyruvate ferredoxin oxidoreductase n=1 Tax=Marivivens niveibacter TaxID=1930667 RepID=A0A251WX52_9RHOB|nr:biopolymer transporter ExbD [Marivivens niveibacter]OUD08725.1 indolepyruvate ferredoxin oxidoreductase [Marivivens niveibacter]